MRLENCFSGIIDMNYNVIIRSLLKNPNILFDFIRWKQTCLTVTKEGVPDYVLLAFASLMSSELCC